MKSPRGRDIDPPEVSKPAPPVRRRRNAKAGTGSTRASRRRRDGDGGTAASSIASEFAGHTDMTEGLGSTIAPLANWNPTRRPPRHPVRRVPYALLHPTKFDHLKDPEQWELIGVETAAGLGHVRNGMNYAQAYTTCATLYEKARRIQFLEGPNEPAVADHLEMCPRYIDFQFQPVVLIFRRADGKIIRKYPDVAYELADHRVVFGEIKSNDAWFVAEGVRRPLERVSTALQELGLGPIHKIKGEPFRRDDTVEAHSIAMEARLTTFDRDADATAVRKVIMASGGHARYVDVVAALGGSRSVAVDKLYAMLLRRIVDFDLRSTPKSETVVTAPRAVSPYALREILARFEKKAA
ncbi:hypothetical protein QE363_000694 [Sphingomonas sp. SORGH_AS870]|uniref:hypothetical protein n=1 Tax=Sphingomonas sp. SORGH_AS_0870 TaxID=3041801 RepID=UPI00285C7BF9|nr:hypothetical protein [Sphingomonas sp. SORGH_AS_0870]MDR6144901.1 hypothetical protein [Sphingomonas sp. SORGH_AS_0870]